MCLSFRYAEFALPVGHQKQMSNRQRDTQTEHRTWVHRGLWKFGKQSDAQ